MSSIMELIKPRGHIAIIDDPETVDLKTPAQFKTKALTFSWEFMFARTMFQTDDIKKQHELLNRLSGLIDSGEIVSTATNHLGKLSTENCC